jgi:hypothetical protein
MKTNTSRDDDDNNSILVLEGRNARKWETRDVM